MPKGLQTSIREILASRGIRKEGRTIRSCHIPCGKHHSTTTLITSTRKSIVTSSSSPKQTPTFTTLQSSTSKCFTQQAHLTRMLSLLKSSQPQSQHQLKAQEAGASKQKYTSMPHLQPFSPQSATPTTGLNGARSSLEARSHPNLPLLVPLL